MCHKAKVEYIKPEDAIERFLKDTLGPAERMPQQATPDETPQARRIFSEYLSKHSQSVHWADALVKGDSLRAEGPDEKQDEIDKQSDIHASINHNNPKQPARQPSIKDMIKRLKREKLLADKLSDEQRKTLGSHLAEMDAQKVMMGNEAAAVARSRISAGNATQVDDIKQDEMDDAKGDDAKGDEEGQDGATLGPVVAPSDPFDRPGNAFEAPPDPLPTPAPTDTTPQTKTDSQNETLEEKTDPPTKESTTHVTDSES